MEEIKNKLKAFEFDVDENYVQTLISGLKNDIEVVMTAIRTASEKIAEAEKLSYEGNEPERNLYDRFNKIVTESRQQSCSLLRCILRSCRAFR